MRKQGPAIACCRDARTGRGLVGWEPGAVSCVWVMPISHGDRIPHICGLYKAEQFTPELLWLLTGRSGMSRRREGQKSEKYPKPHAGFGLPVCLHGDKMRPFGPVRSLNEEECFALVYVLASAHFLWFRFLVLTIW